MDTGTGHYTGGSRHLRAAPRHRAAGIPEAGRLRHPRVTPGKRVVADNRRPAWKRTTARRGAGREGACSGARSTVARLFWSAASGGAFSRVSPAPAARFMHDRETDGVAACPAPQPEAALSSQRDQCPATAHRFVGLGK